MNEITINLTENTDSLIHRLISKKISIQLRKLFKIALPDIAKDNNAFQSLKEYFDDIMSEFSTSLTSNGYERMLNVVWTEAVMQIKFVLDKQINVCVSCTN